MEFPPTKMESTFENPKSIAPETVVIPEGDFLMGSTNGAPNESPIHRVWIDAFAIAKYPVTNLEYATFMEMTGHSPPRFWRETKFQGENQPVVGPSWFDAVAYCEWLRDLTCRAYRLPTEAEREKAARGGLEECEYPWGNELPHDHLGGRNARHFPVGNRWPQRVRPVQYVGRRPRMVCGLVRCHLLQHITGAKPNGARARQPAGSTRRVVAAPHPVRPLCRTQQPRTR